MIKNNQRNKQEKKHCFVDKKFTNKTKKVTNCWNRDTHWLLIIDIDTASNISDLFFNII